MADLQVSKNGNRFIPNSFQTPNFIADELMYLLTPPETCCLIYAIRHILGFQDKIVERKANISLSSFARTGLSVNSIRTALDGLAFGNILLPEGKPTNDGQLYKLQDNADAILWEKLRKRKAESDEGGKKRTEKATVASLEKRKQKTAVSSNDTPEQPIVGRYPGLSSNDPPGLSSNDNIKTQIKTQDQTHTRVGTPATNFANAYKESARQALIRGEQTHQKDVLGGVDLSGYPNDVVDVIRETCELFHFRTPRSKRDRSKWIEDARDLRHACGEFGLEPIRKFRQEMVAYMQQNNGVFKFSVCDLGSLVKSVNGVAAQMRSAQDVAPTDPLAALRAAGFTINGARA